MADVTDDPDVQSQQWWNEQDREMDRRAAAVRRAGELAGQEEMIGTVGELLDVARFLVDG